LRASNFQNMHSSSTLRSIAILLVVILFTTAACTRITSTEFGSGLIPAVDGVNTFDTTMELITDSFEDTDTTRIYKQDNHVIGTLSADPIFGKTSAALHFELFPDYFPFFIQGTKDSVVADSAVLILSYKTFYGDSSQPLRLTVEEIAQQTKLDPYIVYPSNFPLVYPIASAGSLGTTKTIDIRRLSDSVYNRYESASNQIRIRLRDDVARRFIKSYDSTNAYRNDTVFRKFFAGFSVKAESALPANALLYVNLLDTNTKLALYYNSSTTGSTSRDTNVVYFHFNGYASGEANYITRNRAGSEVASRLTTTSKPDSLVYVQASPGTYVRIKIPNLAKLNNRIIHRAELITEQVPDNGNLSGIDRYMEPPQVLLLSIYDSVNKRKRNIPSDFAIGSTGPNTLVFGGYRSYKTVPGYDRLATYSFDLSRYVQGIVTRKDTSFVMRLTAPNNDSINYTPAYPNNYLSQMYYLSPSYYNEAGRGRVRLGGGTHSRFRMRLRIVYSRI
jgi:hypothetical protein